MSDGPAADTRSPFDLQGRQALVTGGSRGIGRSIVAGLLAAGSDVAFTYVEDDGPVVASELAAQVGRHCVALAVANGTERAADRAFEGAEGALGRIDILVMNAWVDVRESIMSLDTLEVQRQVRANFIDNLELATRCAAEMRKRKWGRILLIGSINQVSPLPVLPVYAAMKCAMASVMRSLAIELAEDHVTANCLLPGLVETDRNAHRRAPGGDWDWHSTHSNYMKRAATPEEVAGFAVFLCSEASSFCTGSEYLVDGGAHIPGKFNWQQQSRRTSP